MRILGISGSLRRGSHNTALLRAAADLLPPGAELVEFELGGLPLYDADLDVDPPPAAVARMRAEIERADALLISTPEYNASIPGVLKNAVDWASRPFPGNALRTKPVLVVGASTGVFGAVWAQAALRGVLDHAGAQVVDSELAVASAAQAWNEDGSLRDQATADRLSDQLAELTAVGSLESRHIL